MPHDPAVEAFVRGVLLRRNLMQDLFRVAPDLLPYGWRVNSPQVGFGLIRP
jgi:hypothetical protein